MAELCAPLALLGMTSPAFRLCARLVLSCQVLPVATLSFPLGSLLSGSFRGPAHLIGQNACSLPRVTQAFDSAGKRTMTMNRADPAFGKEVHALKGQSDAMFLRSGSRNVSLEGQGSKRTAWQGLP